MASVFAVNKPHVSTERFDNEIMIVNLESGNYYSLTGVAADVWDMIENGCSQEAILNEVQMLYRGSPEMMRNALTEFASDLTRENLVVPAESRSAEPQYTPVLRDSSQPTDFTAPVLEKYTDMQELLLIDPIHEVNDEYGWPKLKP